MVTHALSQCRYSMPNATCLSTLCTSRVRKLPVFQIWEQPHKRANGVCNVMPLRVRWCGVAQPELRWPPQQPVSAAALAVVEVHQPQRLAAHMQKWHSVVWLHSNSNSNPAAWLRGPAPLGMCHLCVAPHLGVAPRLATAHQAADQARPCHQHKHAPRRLSIRSHPLLESRHSSLTIAKAISHLLSKVDHPCNTV